VARAKNDTTMMDGHGRRLHMLEARLEGLACVCERSPSAPRFLETQVTAVAAATRRAVELDLLTADEAAAVWAAVAVRHPRADWCRSSPLAA
jgi:hypothetical protein